MFLKVHKEFFLVFLLLFVPQASFAVFYSVIFLYMFSTGILSFQISNSRALKAGFFLLFFYLCCILIKAILFDNIYDLKEFVKLLLFVFVFLYVRELNVYTLEKVFLIYVAIDFFVSILQFLRVDSGLLTLVTDLYSNTKHIEFLYMSGSVRSLGLSPGPGQHGVLSLLMVFFFATLLTYDRVSYMRFLGLIFSFSSLILSQSKTAIIISFIVGPIFIIYASVLKKGAARFVIFIFTLFCVVVFLVYFQDMMRIFRDLNRVFESGLQVSSMIARFDMWQTMISTVADANPILWFVGAGRSYFEYRGLFHSFFDSDYVYVFVSYGVIGFSIFVMYIVFYLCTNFLKYFKMNVLDKIIYFVLFSGALSSLALDFFFDVKVIAVLALLFSIKANKNHIYRG